MWELWGLVLVNKDCPFLTGFDFFCWSFGVLLFEYMPCLRRDNCLTLHQLFVNAQIDLCIVRHYLYRDIIHEELFETYIFFFLFFWVIMCNSDALRQYHKLKKNNLEILGEKKHGTSWLFSFPSSFSLHRTCAVALWFCVCGLQKKAHIVSLGNSLKWNIDLINTSTIL